nr:P-U3 [Pinctada fucata]
MLTGLPQIDDNLHYKVYFSPVDEYGQPKGGQMLFRICDANSTQASVTDLSPSSYYSIRIAAAHCLSVESEGDPTLVRTLDIIPSAPLNVRIEGKKANAIAVGWDPPAVMGTLTNYTIYVGEESGPVTTVAVDPSITTYAIYDLYEGTLYNVQVSASSDNGESPKSQPIQVITDAYAQQSFMHDDKKIRYPIAVLIVPMAPRNLRAIDHNLTSVTIRWDPPTAGPGMIRGYRVNFTTDTGFDNYQEVLTSGPSDTQVTITGLAPATLYYFQVYARTMKRLGMGSAVILNMTKADVPSKPMSVMHQLVDNGLQTIQLSWQPPNNTYGPILKYVLHWGVRGGATRKENLTAYILTWSSDLLDDNTTHDFKLSAVNELGEGEPTYLSIRTKAKRKK